MRPLPSGVELREATEADLPAIGQLRATVGWQAHRWALLDALRPPQARCLVAQDGRADLIAVGSGIAYGRLGVVGNMVVADAHRRQGLGSAVLRRVLDFLERERGCTQVELSATATGRLLYERHGFKSAGASAMVRIEQQADAPRAARAADAAELPTATLDDLAELVRFDEPRFGGDRATILASALADRERPVSIARRHGEIVGYAVHRVAAGRLGPWVADDLAAAKSLLSAAFEGQGHDAVSTNIAMANEPGVEWLRSLGARVDPWDGRMRRGSGIVRREATIYGNAVGALG